MSKSVASYNGTSAWTRVYVEQKLSTTKFIHSKRVQVCKDDKQRNQQVRNKNIRQWHKHMWNECKLSERKGTNDNCISLIFGTSPMTRNHDCIDLIIVKFRHSSLQRVCNDQKLLSCNVTNDDFTRLVHHTCEIALVYDWHVAEDN